MRLQYRTFGEKSWNKAISVHLYSESYLMLQPCNECEHNVNRFQTGY